MTNQSIADAQANLSSKAHMPFYFWVCHADFQLVQLHGPHVKPCLNRLNGKFSLKSS